MGILFLTLLVAPLFFQILLGSNLISIFRKMKFWVACVISILLVFVTYFINVEVILHNMAKYEIRDGLPFVGLTLLGIIMLVAVMLTILIQILVKRVRKRIPEENPENA